MDTHIFYSKFWSDPYIIGCTQKEKIYFAYLFTNEYVNILGIYELPRVVVKAVLGFGDSELDKMNEKFQADGKFVFYRDWVAVLNFDKYQKYRGTKNEIAKEKIKEGLPKPLLDTLSKGYVYPSDSTRNKRSEIRNKKPKVYSDKFEEFWAVYPRKVAKAKANDAWRRDELDLEADSIIKFVKDVKDREQWVKEEGRYIPHPTTFINQARYQDDPVAYGKKMVKKGKARKEYR